jgi:hypothetical protein
VPKQESAEGVFLTFLICPRMPLTVRTAAPSNRATSNADVNISFTKAVFLNILYGYPTSFNFLTTETDWSWSRTTPVALIRNVACRKSQRKYLVSILQHISWTLLQVQVAMKNARTKPNILNSTNLQRNTKLGCKKTCALFRC